jgi:ATP-dependent DNA helicase RecG
MSLEGQLLDRKSLRAISGRTANWDEIAKDCIAFANATGGRLQVGIENDQSQPPTGKQIPPELPDTLRRRISEKTVNVVVLVDIVTTPRYGATNISRESSTI